MRTFLHPKQAKAKIGKFIDTVNSGAGRQPCSRAICIYPKFPLERGNPVWVCTEFGAWVLCWPMSFVAGRLGVRSEAEDTQPDGRKGHRGQGDSRGRRGTDKG